MNSPLCVTDLSLVAGGDVGDHSLLFPVVVMLELLGLLVPQVVLRPVEGVLVVGTKMLGRVRLVRDLGTRRLKSISSVCL